MTLNLRAEATDLGLVALVAEAATVDDVDIPRRIITGTLAPYGEAGRTNLGARALRAGAVRFRQPADPRVIGLYGHDRERTVSRLIAYEDTPTRLALRARVAATPLGDQLLAEAAEGVRSMLSIELDGCRVDPASGDIVDGLCEFYAHVPIGAYDSANVDHVVAAATSNLDQIGGDVSRRTLARRYSREYITVGGGGPVTPAPAAPVVDPAPAAAAPVVEPAPQMQAAAAPPVDLGQLAQLLAGLQQMQSAVHTAAPAAGPAMLPGGVGALGSAPATPATAPAGGAVAQLAQLQAAVFQGGGVPSHDLRAALADITNTGLDLFQSPAGAIGEQLWAGESDGSRPFVDLMTPDTLDSWKGNGWEWTKKPKMSYYPGDKTEIPTDTVGVRVVEWEAERCAGGWDIDRKFRDFGDAKFWAGFYAAQTESYREISNDRAADALLSYALDITVDGNVPAEYADLNVAQANVIKAAALATAILEDTPNVRRGPDYIVMNTLDWLQLIDFTALDLPAFLSLLKVEPGRFMRSSKVERGKVVAGVKRASKFRELGGGSPIRVEALDIARAGIDSAVFGYTACSLERPGGIISVPLVPVVPA